MNLLSPGEVPVLSSPLKIEYLAEMTRTFYIAAGPALGALAIKEMHGSNRLTPKAKFYLALLGMKSFTDLFLNFVFDPTPGAIAMNVADAVTFAGTLAYGLTRRKHPDTAQIDNHEQI